MFWRRVNESPSVRLHGRSGPCPGGVLEGNPGQRPGDGGRHAGQLGLPDGAGVRSFAPARVGGRQRTSFDRGPAKHGIRAAGIGVRTFRSDGAGVEREHALRQRGRDAPTASTFLTAQRHRPVRAVEQAVAVDPAATRAGVKNVVD